MKVNFNVPVLNLDGKPINEGLEPANLGKVLGNTLVMVSQGDVLKFYGWAMKMNNGDVVDLDKSDQETLKKFVTENQNLTILVKAQILELLEKKEQESAGA